jgi:hypothetical protein
MQKSSESNIERNTIIDVTKQNFSFGQSVYLTKNITGFREINNINPDIQISWIKILSVFILGIIIISTSSFYPSIDRIMIMIGILLIIIGVFGSITNILYPKEYGLEITFNSGDKFVFINNDKESLRFIINNLRTMIESEKKEKANKISNNYNNYLNNSVYHGNIVQGEVGENVSFTSNDDNSQGIHKS